MKAVLAIIILIAITGCKTAERYEYKINLPAGIYTQPADPNDQAYRGLVNMNSAWEKTFGPSERSLILFNWWTMRDRTGNTESAVLGIEAALKKLESDMKSLKDRYNEKDTD